MFVQIGYPFLFVRAVRAFKYCDVWIVGGERLQNTVRVGCVGPFVGVVDEYDTGCAAGVCDHEANVDESIQQGIAKEEYVIVSRRSIDGVE